MKKSVIFGLLPIIGATLLSGCFHSKTQAPPGYCHHLTTQINNPRNMRAGNTQSPAVNRSVLVDQYKAMGCD